jgi:serine/threonine protein kinase
MPSSLSPELQSTIRKCLSTDRRKRMTVRQVLKNDPWLYKGADTSDFMAKSSKADDACEILDRTEREHRLRRNFIADAEHDRMITHVNKTLIYHPVNASTYYTTSALPAAAGTEGGLEIMRAELLQDLRYHARRLGVQSINRTHIQKTPVIKKIVNHLRFNKNQFSDSSDMHAKGGLNSVERIYQRLTKIQTFEYKITGRESAQRFSSRMSSGTTQSFTSSSASASLDDNTFCSISKRYELEMTKLIRLACELFGVTFVHCHHNRLLCVVTMRNDGRKMSSLSTLMLQGDNSSTTTDSPTLVNQSMDDSDTEKQIYVGKRLSMPLAKKASSLTVEETNRRASMNIDRSLNKEHSGTCVFEVEVGVSPNHLATVNFIKQQGTTIVFKLVSGWIGTVLGLDS